MYRTDEEVKKDVVDTMYWDSRVNASDIGVEVVGGKVILTGTLPTHFARSSAADDALRVAGVMGVQNKTFVEYPESIVVPSDEELRFQVEQALERNIDVDIEDLEISVVGGVVKLNGTVDVLWKKERAEWITSNLRGIVAIENNLTVVPTGDVADKEIARDIIAALEREVLIDADRVNVRVDRGLVTLSGSVESGPARIAAIQAAQLTFGVSSVDDRLVIAPISS